MNNHILSSQIIDKIFSDTWLVVCQLRQGIAITDGSRFYHKACQLIDTTRQHLVEQGYDEVAIENMQYAQCALIDESVMNRLTPDDAYHTWIQSPLQARYFNTLEAGDKLWDRLQAILAQDSPNQDVLLCFDRVLTLGFVGKYRQLQAPDRERIASQLKAQLPPYSLCTLLPLIVKPPRHFYRRYLYWFSWLGGILCLLALWWGLSTALTHSLQQWITQGA